MNEENGWRADGGRTIWGDDDPKPRDSRLVKLVLQDGRVNYGYIDLNSGTTPEGRPDIIEYAVVLNGPFETEGGAA